MILRCENVSLSYDGNIVADNINFTVNEGDYLCILGENGSGKTTLINAVMGTKRSTAERYRTERAWAPER